jgi:small subunit ribosomal protein S16
VAVKIRLKRLGKVRVPQYRIVIVDSRKKRDGKVIEEIGKYHPKEDPSYIDVESERAQYWLSVGAQPSDAVAAILKITGDWQKFKGIDGAEGTLQVKEPKRDKLEIFNEALKEAASEPKAAAVTSKKKSEKKADKAETPAEQTPVEELEARTPAVETPEGAEDEAAAVEAAEKPESVERPDADKREA